MQWMASDLMKSTLQAKDGQIGSVADFLFDDHHWTIRWLVVDTGSWLSERCVLVPTSHVGRPRADEPVISVDLTMQQIKDSPNIGVDEPVSHQMEESVYRSFAWDPYWIGPPLAAPGLGLRNPTIKSGAVSPEVYASKTEKHGDPHLRSLKEITGYQIHAADGEIGHSDAFLIDDDPWVIRYIIIDTRNWWPGKKVLLRAEWISSIDWNTHHLNIGLTKDEIKNAPEYDPDRPLERDYEKQLHQHYKVPGYW